MADTLKILEEALETVGERYIFELQSELEAQDHVAFGKLLNSFRVEIKKFFDTYSMQITSNSDYMTLVNEGRGSVNTNEDEIRAWVDVKGISFSSEEEKDLFIRRTVAGLNASYPSNPDSFKTNFIENAFERVNPNAILNRIIDGIDNNIEASAELGFSGNQIISVDVDASDTPF